MTLDEFVGLSAALTGYDADVLKPSADTQRVSEALYAELSNPDNKISPAQLQQLTDTWNAIAHTPAAQLEDQVWQQIVQNPAINRLAQNIIYMWYLGIWYDLGKNPNSFATPNNDHVVSSVAYINGLVWGEMGAHPMGFSTGDYGYWAHTPTLPAINAVSAAVLK
ncbi:sorbitol dehydrogenase family protein [Chitinophaga pendula]|uniref:sugar dehydrogenase complex small subunit n=1 Tax=Chitinophaga TaxID=79328 RepID=UPI000BAF5356|nr:MULTISPECIES: sugar dehydrogenase complex small subunit [Chitinophaga]ASZ14479.1 hypothetical protein CK934_27810 [Chitinophaga sp. MD30]UCJ07864.1 sorbitol dehydrogenase family protein [Chitinophaga pendula]